jgi:hypothetical protein
MSLAIWEEIKGNYSSSILNKLNLNKALFNGNEFPIKLRGIYAL